MFNVKRIIGLDCPNKFLVSSGDKPLIFTNSQRKASIMVLYLEGMKSDEEFLRETNDNKKALKLLKKERLAIKSKAA